MDVRYEDKKLEEQCTDEREMRRRRGHLAPKLKRRINALRAASSVKDLRASDPLGYWHPLTANLDGLWAGTLSPNYRILIRPEGAAAPEDAETVTVIDIDDYHG